MKLALSLGCVLLASIAVGALAPRSSVPTLPAALLGSVCLQDQYGDQYSFTVDEQHGYVFGSAMINSQFACGTTPWPLTGSYTQTEDGLLLELTVANPAGIGQPCVSTFKLKGLFPRFAWYYDFGYGSQESAYVTCGSDATASSSSGGVWGVPH